jgi:O-antigen/teichoic acid export membrane protein
MAGQVTSVFVQLLYFIVLARLMGITEYGKLAGAIALIAVASQYSSLGSGLVFLRHVSPDLTRFPRYWGYVILSTLCGGVVIVSAIVAASHWLLPSMAPLTILFLALGDSFFAQITNGASRVFQTFERMQFTALSTLITNFLRLLTASTLLFTVHHATVATWAIASSTVSLASSILAIIAVTKMFGSPRFSVSLMRTHVREGLLFSSTISTSSVYNDIDKVVLVHYGMNAANGIYTAAYKAIDTAFMVVRSIHSAAFPRFCREGAKGISHSRAFAQRILKKTSLLSLAMGAGLFLVAPVLPLVIGHSFASSVVVLRWLCLIPIFRACHLSAGDALAGAGFQRYRFSYELGAAIFNLGLNLWFIPLYSWKGAAVVSLLTDGGLALVSWITVTLVAASANRAAKQLPCSAVESADVA